MTQLAILTDAARRRFDRPRELTRESRRRAFHVTGNVRLALGRIEQPTNKVGFLLQYGYFKAGARFYSPMASKRRDIEYVQRALKIEFVDLTQYTGTVMRRHRQIIRKLLNWQTVDDAARDGLMAEAHRYVANQEHPKEIFRGLVDLCWKHQWVIPSYHDLADIITRCFNEADRTLMSAVERALTPEHVAQLEVLLKPIERAPAARFVSPITSLKTIDQSLRPGKINPSMEILALFRDHFIGLQAAIDALPLSDKATEYYANWLQIANQQQITQFPNRHKAHLHLLAFIKHQFFQRQDAAINVLLKSVTALRTAVRNQLRQHDQSKKAERNVAIQALMQARLTASEFADGVMAIVNEEVATPSEKYHKIESLAADYREAGGSDLRKIQKLEADIAGELNNETYYSLLGSQSLCLQRRVAGVAKTVEFHTMTSEPTLIAAIQHFRDTDGRIGPCPPSEFLTKQELHAVYSKKGINTPLYKCLLFIHMADGIKAGRLNLNYSCLYRAIQDYLIPIDEWRADKWTLLEQTGLTQYADGVQMLANQKDSLDERYRIVNETDQAGQNPHLFVSERGRGRVRTPKTNFEERKFIASTLGHNGIVPILQLLKSVNQVCEFTSTFKHFSTKRSKMTPTEEMFMAGILANGCNIGVGKLAKISTGLPEYQLHNTVSWYFDVDNLRKANDTIVGLIKELALANNYLHSPPTIHSASDGRKMNVAVDCLHASYSFKYHGKEKGVTDYVFIDERQALTHAQVFTSSDREAPYVIDGLMANPVPAGQSIHSTDTHGYTEQIFGATHLLGIAFAPRIKNIAGQRTYAFSTPKTYRRKGYDLVPSRTINQKLILDNWDDILRFIVTIKTRCATASQLFKRLSSYAKEHPLYKALKEFGRIIKSQFILTYFGDVTLRQQIQKQLSRVEQAQKFSKAVFFDRDRAFQHGTLREQESAIICKLILQNAIILWNYLSLSERIIDTPDPDERRHLVDAIGGGSVITWEHVNLRGGYDFTHTAANDASFDIDRIKALRLN